jgi:hypothetical protein
MFGSFGETRGLCVRRRGTSATERLFGSDAILFERVFDVKPPSEPILLVRRAI